MTVKQLPDGAYQFIGAKENMSISFHDVGNGVIVGQARPRNTKNAHAYGYTVPHPEGQRSCSLMSRSATRRTQPC